MVSVRPAGGAAVGVVGTGADGEDGVGTGAEMPGPGDARCRQAAIPGDRTRERTRGERHTEGRAPDEPGPQEGSPVQPVRERTQAGQAAPGASGRELPHADAERQPHHAVRRVRAEEERMDVPRRRQEQRQVDQEAHHRGEHHEGARQHGQPHGDLGEGDRHTREHRRVPEQRSNGPAGVPVANPRSWVPTKSGLPWRRKFGSRNFCAPANTNVPPRNALRMRSGHDICRHPSTNEGLGSGARGGSRSGRPGLPTAVRVWAPMPGVRRGRDHRS